MTGRSAAVVGAGPAGRALAHRLEHHGVDVTLIDPHPDRQWHATFAAWTDELPKWLGDNAIAARIESVRVRGRTDHHVARGYSVLDNTALRAALDLPGAHLIATRARAVHPDRVECEDGTVVRADQVIDCRGALPHDAPAQTAFGIVVDSASADRLLDGAPALLMQWSLPQDLGASPDDLPSFLYAVPLGGGATLLEETCLAGHPPLAPGELERRLQHRLGDRKWSATRSETVSFPLIGASAQPWRDPVFTYGAAGGLKHPTTGYSVAAALRCADTVAAAVADGHDPADALWPSNARAVHNLRIRGLSALLRLTTAQTLEFFDVFFEMPVAAQRSYLSDRDDLTGTMEAMSRVIAKVGMRSRMQIVRGAMARPAWAGDIFTDR